MTSQEKIIKIYRFFTGLVYNITIIILLLALFIGLFRTIQEIGFLFTEATVRLSVKDLITNILSIVILLELTRAFVEYFEHERIRIEILVEMAIAFMIRELMINIFANQIKGLDALFWILGIFLLVGARTLAVLFKPSDKFEKKLGN